MERNLLLPVTVALPAVRFGQFYKTQGCPLLSDVFAAGELSQYQTQKLSLLFPFPNLVLGGWEGEDFRHDPNRHEDSLTWGPRGLETEPPERRAYVGEP